MMSEGKDCFLGTVEAIKINYHCNGTEKTQFLMTEAFICTNCININISKDKIK